MNKRKLLVATALLVAAAVISGAAMTGVFTQDDTDSDGPTVSTTSIETASFNQSNQYGLLDQWQSSYNGTGASYDYNFNGTSGVTKECGNCHMALNSSGSKHEPPLHPLGLNSSDTGDWFFDDNAHRGPNTQLATQQAGILAKGDPVDCGDCHTPTNASGFATSNSEKTSDPHSVHNDVMTREGCIRCHNYDNETFSGQVEFTQSNATRLTYGIANPINMTRVWDGKYLSVDAEATYNSTLSDTGGAGWNKYGTNDDTNNGTTQYACGDCHGLLHDSGGLSFAFNDSASNRKGPYALVNNTHSIGISSGGEDFTCGDCHVEDAHAVHTNGKMVSASNFSYANGTSTDPSVHESNARGAEYCDECHSQNIVDIQGNHGAGAEKYLGLNGSKKDNLPDSAGKSVSEGDCGFCHQ